MHLTPTELKVLRQAIDDGGSVELSGIDMHDGWTKRERTAALKLQEKGLGRHDVPFGNTEPKRFDINAAGRAEIDTRK